MTPSHTLRIIFIGVNSVVLWKRITVLFSLAFFPWAAVAEISMSFGQLLYKFESMEKVLDEGKIISSSVDADGYVGVWLMYEGKLFYCQLHDVLDISKNWCRMNQKADN